MRIVIRTQLIEEVLHLLLLKANYKYCDILEFIIK
jgi:hypothetical protein